MTLTAASFGLLVPVLYYVIKWLTGPLGGWVVVVWPSSITLMAIEGGGPAVAFVAVTMSIMLNGLLYAATGRLLAPLVLSLAGPSARRDA